METVVIKDEGIQNVLVEDLVRRKDANEMLDTWHLPIDADTDFRVRDSVLEAMKQTGTRPTEWIREREFAMGSYPDLEDPDFAAQLTRKKEFAELASKAVSEETCTRIQDEFEATSVQRLVARFLHPTTPYHSMLLNHGVGVGKTCSAITVAETYLELFPGNTVYILAPQAIADGFRKTIFDVEKLVPAPPDEQRLTGDRWRSPQCTGMTYLRLTDTTATEDKEEIDAEVKKVVRSRYAIMGYLAFAKMLEKKFKDEIPAVIKGKAREERENDLLRHWFSDHLVVIDEAHNLRDSDAETTFDLDEADPDKLKDAAEGKLLTPFLKRMAYVAEGMRLMLMTATPMYNTAPEIMFLLNILHVNATKDPESEHLMDRGDLERGQFTEAGEAKLVYLIRRYVSYMRGEHPNTFPLRLVPREAAGAAFAEAYPTKSISRVEDVVALTTEDKKILAMLPLVVHSVGAGTPVGKLLTDKLVKYRGEEGRTSEFVLERTIQMANMTYPNGVYGNRGWPIFWDEKANERASDGTKITQFEWKAVGTPVAKLEDVMAGAALRRYAPKIASIVEKVVGGEGVSFVFSKYIQCGALPIAIALELAGGCRVLANGVAAPLLKLERYKKPKFFYILLTSNPSISPDFKGLLRYATSNDNKDGSKVKVILGSQITSEGLDLKHVRQLHILDGWYHMNRIEQIEGRGVRFCSHAALPLAQRNCTIFLHAVAIPTYETGDLYAYRLAVRKAQPIGRVTRLIKIHAWDCMLNHAAVALEDVGKRTIYDAFGKKHEDYDLADKPYTSFCDFSNTCEFVCGRALPKSEWGKDMSTYSEFDARYKFLKRQEALQDLFSKEVAVPLRYIQDVVYEGIPASVAAIGIREALDSLRIKQEKDGVYGTLILKQGYVLFQPEHVTDTEIPLALRYGRAYRRIPRIFVPQRKQILQRQPEGPAVHEEGAAAAVVAEAGDALASATDSLRTWTALVTRMMAERAGVLPCPAPLSKEVFHAWRWLLYHFRAVPETVAVATLWWMDTVWSGAERTAVLRDWTMRSTALSEEETRLAELLRPVELYRGRAVTGFLTVSHATKALEVYCFAEGYPEPSTSCDLYKPRIDTAIGAPVDRSPTAGTMAPLYGYLSLKEGTPVFRSVDPSTGSLTGAECAGNSRLAYNLERIKKLQEEARKVLPAEDPFLARLLNDEFIKIPAAMEAESKLRKKAVEDRYRGVDSETTLEYICEMSRHQLCPYLEFVLRVLDQKKAGRKRWFLSLVDAARSGVKMT